MKEALKEFSFAIEIGLDNETYLKSLGYRRGAGDCSYEQNWYVVMPFKNVYYPVSGWSGIKATTKDIVRVDTKLVVEYPKCFIL